MDTLQITLFGHVNVSYSTASTPLKLSSSTQSLLAYLLLKQQFVSRDLIMAVFWPDYQPDRARSNLTTTLWRLRQVLEPEGVRSGAYLLTNHIGEVGFNWESNHTLDITLLEQRITPFLHKPVGSLHEDEVTRVKAVLPLYRGELLEGMYEDWALRERERLRLLYLNCLAHLMEYHANQHDFAQSINYGHEILRLDPLREEIHRRLMGLYVETGQRTLAVRQYLQCCDLLNQELGITPLEETQVLYQQIVGTPPLDSLTHPHVGNKEILSLSHELQLVKRHLSEATRSLTHISQLLSYLNTGY